MQDKHFELLNTPPYVSDLQPIEMIWAFTKHLVARQSTFNRTQHEAAAQMRQAMDAVTADLCVKEVNHVERWIDSFIASEKAGSLKRWPNLAALIESPPAADADDIHADGDEEDAENQPPDDE